MPREDADTSFITWMALHEENEYARAALAHVALLKDLKKTKTWWRMHAGGKDGAPIKVKSHNRTLTVTLGVFACCQLYAGMAEPTSNAIKFEDYMDVPRKGAKSWEPLIRRRKRKGMVDNLRDVPRDSGELLKEYPFVLQEIAGSLLMPKEMATEFLRFPRPDQVRAILTLLRRFEEELARDPEHAKDDVELMLPFLWTGLIRIPVWIDGSPRMRFTS